MCRECELVDYPTAGWPWLPCSTPPRGYQQDRLQRQTVEAAESLTDALMLFKDEFAELRKTREARQANRLPPGPPPVPDEDTNTGSGVKGL